MRWRINSNEQSLSLASLAGLQCGKDQLLFQWVILLCGAKITSSINTKILNEWLRRRYKEVCQTKFGWDWLDWRVSSCGWNINFQDSWFFLLLSSSLSVFCFCFVSSTRLYTTIRKGFWRMMAQKTWILQRHLMKLNGFRPFTRRVGRAAAWRTWWRGLSMAKNICCRLRTITSLCHQLLFMNKLLKSISNNKQKMWNTNHV